jgi:hypothetical protein
MSVGRADRASLAGVSTSALERLRGALATGALRPPLTRADLLAAGIRNQVDAIAAALAGHNRRACESILDVVLAERARLSHPAPELVWTGPEGASATARDTAVVLRALFEGAQHRVVLAGYSFDHGKDILEPLHRVMVERGVEAIFFVDIKQPERRIEPPEAHAAERLGDFVARNWPFGGPFPRIYYDRRALHPGYPYISLHAKCVVIDEVQALVSSANFTQRGQERNIEAGVLLHDPHFASHLAMQWLGLIDAGLVAEWVIA